MSASTPPLDELAKRWADRCFGAPERSPFALSYDPSAARACQRCGSLLLGTCAGDIFVLRLIPEVEKASLEAEPCQIPAQLTGGVSSIDGCFTCGLKTVFIGTGDGGVFSLTPSGSCRKLCTMGGRVEAVRLFPLGTGDRLLMVTDERRGLRVLFMRDGQVSASLERILRWSPRWVDIEAQTTGASADLRVDWLMISADGRVARASLFVAERALTVDELLPLASPPYCATFVNYDGKRLIAWANDGGLRLALPDRTPEGDLVLSTRGGIQFIAVRQVFEHTLLIVCDNDGRIEACRWRGQPNETHATWHTWPTIASSAVGLWLGPHSQEDATTLAIALSRDHRFVKFVVHNQTTLREALRAASGWSGATDAERFAQLTVSPSSLTIDEVIRYARTGGQRTLDGVLLWLRSVRNEAVSSEEVIRLGAELLIAGARMGRDTVIRLARDVYTELVYRIRRTYSDELDRLQPWLIFMARFFLAARAFSEPRLQIERLINASDPGTPDAFIYAARMGRQGFDVLRELPQAGVWAMAAKRNPEGTSSLAVAARDGTVWKAEVSHGGELGTQVWLKGDPAPSRSGPYSRVLRFATLGDGSDVLLAVPRDASRHGDGDADERGRDAAAQKLGLSKRGFSVPSFPPEQSARDLQSDHDRTQVYAIHPVDGRFLLGTRSVEVPLALWQPRPSGGSVEFLDTAFGAQTRARGASIGGVRRIWAITDLCPEWLAVGAQDGYLRLIPWDRGRVDLARMRSMFLGSPVRALLRFNARQRSFLAAGTEGGHLFVFEINTEQFPELTIKFREMFRSYVMSLFVDTDRGEATKLFVLDLGGRLTSFDVGRGVSFLGRRNRHYDLWHNATAAVWLGKDPDSRDLIAMGGWDRKLRRGVVKLVRIIDYHRSYLSSCSHLLRRARESTEPFAQGRADDLLASMPMTDASIRAALARFQELHAASTLARRIPEALEAYPDDNEEVKALLDAARASMEAPDNLDDAAMRIKAIFEACVDSTGRLMHGLSSSPALRGAAVRRLLTARVLRLWGRINRPQEHLQRWLHIHLQDPEPYVRQDAMRALAEAFYDLVRMARFDDKATSDAFPRPSRHGPPPWGWIIGLVAPYLQAHQAQGNAYDWEIDSLGWGATSVVMNVLRLFPEATLAILSDLGASRVPSSVIHLLRRRLRSAKDTEIVTKVKYYLPWEDDEPLRHELLARSSGEDREILQLTKESPDYAYFYGIAALHRVFHALLRVNDRSEMLRLAVRGHDGDGVSPGGESFQTLEYTRQAIHGEAGVWVELALDRLIRNVAGTQERERIVGSTRDELWVRAAKLPSPEREMAIGVLKHWRRILIREMPHDGDSIGGYVLGSSFHGSPTVFEVHEHPEWLIAVFVHKSHVASSRMVNVWRTIKRLSEDPDNMLVKIVDVVAEAPFPAIVMEHLDGQNLARAWKEMSGCGPGARATLAVTLYQQGLAQLGALHDAGLFHGDVQRRNIVAVGTGAGRRFYLVDFDRAGMMMADHESSSLDGESEYYEERNVSAKSLHALQQEDRAKLLNISVHLFVGSKDLHSVRPDESLVVGNLGDAELERDMREVIDQWQRTRGGPIVAVIYAQEDQEHFLRLRAQLSPVLKHHGLTLWSEADVAPGAEREKEIRWRLEGARFIVLMVTAELLAQSQWQVEIAKNLHQEKRPPKVIPLIIKPVYYQHEWFARLQTLPREKGSIAQCGNMDDAWYAVAQELDKDLERELNSDSDLRRASE